MLANRIVGHVKENRQGTKGLALLAERHIRCPHTAAPIDRLPDFLFAGDGKHPVRGFLHIHGRRVLWVRNSRLHLCPLFSGADGVNSPIPGDHLPMLQNMLRLSLGLGVQAILRQAGMYGDG